MGKYIEKMPPNPTGDQKRDAEAVFSYLAYLREQTNFLLSKIYKMIESGG